MAPHHRLRLSVRQCPLERHLLGWLYGQLHISPALLKGYRRSLCTRDIGFLDVPEAANLLGLGRNTLTRKIQELGIDERAHPDAA